MGLSFILLSTSDSMLEPQFCPQTLAHLSDWVGFFPGFPFPALWRFLFRDQASEEDWENRGFLGPAQWDRLTEAFESDFAECDMVLFGTPTPLVFLSQR